ncbi:MAG: hypothetical protein V1866_04230 [archaeon]
MVNNRKLVPLIAILTIFVVLSMASVSAFSYFVYVTNNTITKDESATFNILVKNTLDQQDYFTISTRDVNWVATTTPSSSKIGPNQEVEFLLELKPKQHVSEGKTYFVPIRIKSEITGFFYEEREKFAVYVVSPNLKSGIYTPTITPSVVIAKTVDPREKLSVKVNLWNRNPRELKGLHITINGQEFSQSYTTDLLPLEDKTNEILFGVSPFLAPGKRTLVLTVRFENKTIAESTTEYEILGYVEMKETAKKENSIFRSVETFSIYNNGNLEGVAEHKISMNLFQRLFTKVTPDARKEKGDDGKSYYVVRENLATQKYLNIKMVTDHRLLVTIILLIIISTALYFVFRSPIIVVKNAEPLGRTTDGLSEIKVRLYLKNRSKKSINHIRITDSIPSIVDIEKNKHIGSMDPVNISKSRNGTLVRWEFDALEAYEERIIAYTIKSKLKLVGGIRLPSARARFDTKKGNERVTHSNNINLIHNEPPVE